MKTYIRKLFSHKGRKYELFYWLSVGTDWMKENNKVKQWIDDKEYDCWRDWVTK